MNNEILLRVDIIVSSILLVFMMIITITCVVDKIRFNSKPYRYFSRWVILDDIYLVMNIIFDVMQLYVLRESIMRFGFALLIFVASCNVSMLSLTITSYILYRIKRPNYVGTFLQLVYFGLSLLCAYVTGYVEKDIYYAAAHFQDSLGGNVYLCCCVVSTIVLSFTTIFYQDEIGHKRVPIRLLFSLLPIIIAIMPNVYGIDLRYIFGTFLICCVFIYQWRGQYILINKQQQELNNNKITIMVSQIKPHFIYNTLNSIAYLCSHDSEKAKKLTIDFAQYLRGNLQSLSNDNLIPFEKELAHTKAYLKIEEARFPNKIKIHYNLNDVDFDIPPLTLQPIVENSVKHGLCQLQDGGDLYIETSSNRYHHIITIRDNGVGFDYERYKKDVKDHYGLLSVSKRIEYLCNGTLEITSKINEGTNVVIKLTK